MKTSFLIVLLSVTAAAAAGPYRFTSPGGHYDLLVEPLVDDWTHMQKGQPGIVKQTQEQYVITFYVAGASAPLNAIFYSDSGTPATPDVIVGLMQWSPNEEYVAFPDRPHAWENRHTLQRVAALRKKKIWNLEADHVHWVDDQRFVGDQNTKKMPGGIMQFDGEAGAADLLISPTNGIGYQIAAVAGKEVTIAEMLNDLPSGKTTWEQFTPACFILNMDTLKKRSAPCPAAQDASPPRQEK